MLTLNFEILPAMSIFSQLTKCLVVLVNLCFIFQDCKKLSFGRAIQRICGKHVFQTLPAVEVAGKVIFFL